MRKHGSDSSNAAYSNRVLDTVRFRAATLVGCAARQGFGSTSSQRLVTSAALRSEPEGRSWKRFVAGVKQSRSR